jgi:phage terminase small subunit
MIKPLNPRQESFCAFMAAGSSAGRAYEKAGYSSRGNVADSAAERLLRNVGIKNRIAELRKPVTTKLLLTKDRKRELLRDIAEDPDRPALVRLRAIEIDSKLAGHFEPERMEIEAGPITLDTVREIAARIKIASPLLMSRMHRAGRVGKPAADIDADAVPFRPAVRRPLSRVNKP